MNRIIMCGHTGSYNKECEAIVRSTAKILYTKLPDKDSIP